MTFSNRSEPGDVLYVQEADALVAVLKYIMKETGTCPKHGTFMLRGVTHGSTDYQEIVSFDFRRGPAKRFRRNPLLLNSRGLADYVLKTDAERELVKPFSALGMDADGKLDFPIGAGVIRSFDDLPPYLSLRTTCGRFTCAFYADGVDDTVMSFLYCVVAQTLASMGKEDMVLQSSCSELSCAGIDDYTSVIAIQRCVIYLFKECSLPELKVWKAWHDEANVDGNLKLFFE